MRIHRLAWVVFLALSLTATGQESEKDKNERIRAKEPTTVTVEGRSDPVQTQNSERSSSGDEKRESGLKAFVSKTWGGIVRFGGWLMNANDDIPSERERRSRSQSEGAKK